MAPLKKLCQYQQKLFLLATFITHMSFFHPKVIQMKLKLSAKVSLLSKISHVSSKSNHANDLITLVKSEREMMSLAQAMLVRKKVIQKIGLSSLLCDQM